MARRRNQKETVLEVLFTAPWWISIVIGLVLLIVMKWIAPSAWGSSHMIESTNCRSSARDFIASALASWTSLPWLRTRIAARRSLATAS